MQRTTSRILLPLCALLAAAVLGSGCSSSLNPRVRDSIATQMKMQRRGIQRCYHFALKADRRTRGRVTLNFSVSDKTGEFYKVRAVRSTVEDPKLVRCVTRRTRKLRSDPKPSRPVDVVYTVDFRPSKRRSRVAEMEEAPVFD